MGGADGGGVVARGEVVAEGGRNGEVHVRRKAVVDAEGEGGGEAEGDVEVLWRGRSGEGRGLYGVGASGAERYVECGVEADGEGEAVADVEEVLKS